MKNQCRRLHDTKIAPSGATSGDGILNKNELFGALDQAGIYLDDEDKESVWRIVDEDQVCGKLFDRNFFDFNE